MTLCERIDHPFIGVKFPKYPQFMLWGIKNIASLFPPTEDEEPFQVVYYILKKRLGYTHEELLTIPLSELREIYKWEKQLIDKENSENEKLKN